MSENEWYYSKWSALGEFQTGVIPPVCLKKKKKGNQLDGVNLSQFIKPLSDP